ncbi:gluconokinase [Lichenifustis flavocetrariae]|uniref:Gluconokinase n=1 Tax=Lichenifustis flavocetrariae TaxID=2949735 RepID=A0AA41Z1D8_9HYPH|nr:gluconokinase [Lichenifustis flavocetrariae]MCW6511053.1 gluconokinase [Lichenifustis flavocetrariae]
MGVSGSGKTTLGTDLAAALGTAFVDGDDLHPAANVEKMAAGTPLDDNDRWPWLDRVGGTLANRTAYPAGIVIACSALRRVYRDRIRAAATGPVAFIYLEAEEADMERRLRARPHHYMPASLVRSQFATLEPPSGETGVLVLQATAPAASNAERAAAWLKHTRLRSA